MAENQQTFILVGQFKDGITPSLRKLNTQIGSLTKQFGKFSGTLRPISKELGVMAMAAERLANTQKTTRNAFEGNTRVLKEYKRTLGQVTSAQDALNRRTPKTIRAPQAPRGGGGGGGLPAAAAAVAGERAGDKGVGFWGMTGAMALANMGVQAATAGFHKLTSSINGFVMGGSQAEQSIIQMAGTLQTLGKVGDFGKSRELADKMMGDLGKVAAKLPGSTEDYLTILQQTLDDQIQAFGSVENVQKNLAGFDPKTGKKLAGGMEQSFTALFGMSAQLAGLRPQIAAMDLNQLRQSPENIRNVQLLTRNPTLAKFYMEELKKSGGDFILALNNAMQKAITPEQIDALKNSFDASYQAFMTLFTDKYGGIFGPMRKVTVSVRNAAGDLEFQSLSAMQLIGQIMRSINEAATAVWSLIQGTGLDPMVMLVKALDEIGYQIYKYANLIMIMVEDIQKGTKDWGDLVDLIGEAIGSAIGGFASWVLSLDYERFFKTIDKLVYNFFKGLFRGFVKSFNPKGKGPLGAFGTSISGTIVSLIAFGAALKVVTGMMAGLSAISAGVNFAPMMASIAGWLGAVGPALAIISRLLPPVAIALAVVAGLGGGLENGMRQLKDVFGETLSSVGGGLQAFGDLIGQVMTFTGDLIFGIVDLTTALFNLIPGVDITSSGLDLLKIALIPITATFQLVEMGLRGLVEGLSNVRLWLLKMTNWGGRNNAKIKEAEAQLKENTQKQNESKRRIDVYNTSLRYGGAAGYAKVLEKDVAAKQRELGKEGLLKAERERLNNELNALNKTLAEARKQAGGNLKPTPGRPGAPKPGTPAAAGAQGGGRGSGATPTAPKPVAPPAPRPTVPPPPPKPPGPPPPANLAPAAVTSIQGAVTNGVRAAQTTQATTWQQVLAPVTAGITTLGSHIVSGFNAARALAAGAKAEAKVHAQNQAKLLNSVIISSNGTKSAVMAVSSKVATQATQAQVASNIARILPMLNTINQSVKSSGMMGGMMPGGFLPPLGGAQGNLGAAARMASASGLQVTSSFRPGDKGYHGVGRAMDFSNSTGPTPQMMAFAQRMIAQYGSSLTELIYSPLGFSIKNGRKVAPLAYGQHFNHVHVAFARGLDSPTMFSTAAAAAQYERMMAPAGAKVATVTANSSEYNGSGHTTVNQNITINGAQDPQRLAEIVFDYASRAAQRVNNASFA